MTSVLSNGKYRSRKDWSTNSIPTLVSLEEEIVTDNLIAPPPKPPRRSSLAVPGLFAVRNGGGETATERYNKRRSSIAVATFLGRRDNKVHMCGAYRRLLLLLLLF